MAKRRVTKRKVRRKTKRKATKFSKAIQSLQRMKGSQRSVAIRNANDKFIRDIVSHVRKLRSKTLPSKMKGKVKKHAKTLRFIGNPKVSLRRKRKVLSQKGGFALLPLLAPLAGAVLGPLVKRIFNR